LPDWPSGRGKEEVNHDGHRRGADVERLLAEGIPQPINEDSPDQRIVDRCDATIACMRLLGPEKAGPRQQQDNREMNQRFHGTSFALLGSNTSFHPGASPLLPKCTSLQTSLVRP